MGRWLSSVRSVVEGQALEIKKVFDEDLSENDFGIRLRGRRMLREQEVTWDADAAQRTRCAS